MEKLWRETSKKSILMFGDQVQRKRNMTVEPT